MSYTTICRADALGQEEMEMIECLSCRELMVEQHARRWQGQVDSGTRMCMCCERFFLLECADELLPEFERTGYLCLQHPSGFPPRLRSRKIEKE
jgi:hypothetical protein